MIERARHEGCGGWLEYETDAIGRTVERCRSCGAGVLLALRRPETAPQRSVMTLAERRRARVLEVVPVVARWDEEFPPPEAIGLQAVLALVPWWGQEAVRQALRMLETGGEIRAAFSRRQGRGPGQRTVKVYWRVG